MGCSVQLVALSGALRERARVGPGLITVSWPMCVCPPTLAAQQRAGGGPAGHLAVFCSASPGYRCGTCRGMSLRRTAQGGGMR
jgi:hypothetical protein